ncbi:hypothetical protein [Streptomyces nigrescens]|uniref:hypothetical protein n=1 Tax=Streptomyces nigrescens TaxID=1920 RepID=UPI0036F87A8F
MTHETEMDEIVAEEWPTFYTPVPVWVLLCGCSAQAYRMYAFLAEHINNRTPGQRIAFPPQKAIAKVLGLKDYRDVAKYREELADLGAIRFKEFRYAGGMRRRYRYWVRFNPPEGFSGMLSLAQFYEANPQVKGPKPQSVKSIALSEMDAATDEVAGQPGGGKKPTTGGGEKPTARGGESPTAQQPDPGEPDLSERDDAPSARSANDARRAPTGSRGLATSGEAASGKKRTRLTRAQYEAIKAVRSLLPDDLEKALPAKTPPNLGTAILEALAVGAPCERTPAQLVEYRVLKRWNGFWASKFYGGELTKGPNGKQSVVGPLVAMLKYQQECGDLSCDDRVNVHTDEPCRACEMRADDRKADRAGATAGARPSKGTQAPPLPPQRPTPGPSNNFRECGCGDPIAKSSDDHLCRKCRRKADELANQPANAPF